MKNGRAALLMAAGLLLFSAGVSAQSIAPLKLDKVNVKQAIYELKHSTGFSFVFATGDIDTTKEINVNASDIRQAAEQILAGQNVSFEIKGKNIVITRTKPQETEPAKGIIIDSRGEAVIGAGVVVKGTTNGVITDMDGRFSLPGIAKGSVLTISCLGYSDQEAVWDGTELKITLQDDSEALEEVVVIGYGTMKKSDLTGSVVKADLSSVKTAPNSNILQALQGGVAGLQIAQTNYAGAEPAIEVRGQTTINGSTDPLIVLDGIIYNGRISDINPSDIEAIDVLKDASSKAVYGAKAANGVLMITSKSGRNEMAPKISWSSNWSFSTPTRDYHPLNREAYLKKIRDVDFKNAYTAESGYTAANPDWSMTSTGMNDIVFEGINNGTEYDWWDNGTRTGHLYTNTVNVTGGSKNVSYFLSGSYTDQGGIVLNDSYKRTTFRSNIDVTLNSWLKIGTNTMLSFNDYSGDSPDIGALSRMPSVVGPKDEDGNWIVNPNGSLIINPFLKMQSNDSDKRHQINTTVYGLVTVPWITGLTYRVNYNYMTNVVNAYNFNRYSASQTGEASKEISNTYYWLLDNIINYTRNFNRHNINATFVYGANKRSFDQTTALGTQFSNFSLGYDDLSQAVTQKTKSNAWEESNLYQMFRFAYNYDSRYFFTATLRRDGFSGFAANHKFGLFPSVGLGWTISREPWMQNAKWVDNLKLRASYGVTGNQTSRYSSLAKVAVTNGYVYGDGAGTSFGTSVSSMANSDLKWETTAEFNAGIDFAFFNNRLNGSVDLYNATTTDLLWDVVVPSPTGFTSVRSNIGKIRNNGIEIVLNGTPVKTNDFSWNINLNFAANRNRVVSLLGEDKDGDGREDDLISSGLFIGESLGTIYGYEVEGIWQLEDEAAGIIPKGYYPGNYKIKDQDGDGEITPANDRVILGHTEPLFTMGIRNTFNYKGFDLSFFLNIINGGKDGYLAYNEKPSYVSHSTGNASNLNWFDCYDYWSPSNTDAKFGIAWNSPAMDADILQSRSFVRLQDLSLGYTFSQKTLQKAKIDALRVFFSGKNLLTFTGWDGWDPEMGLGISSTSYPVMKTYALGVEITF